jgi:hypothetical protein
MIVFVFVFMTQILQIPHENLLYGAVYCRAIMFYPSSQSQENPIRLKQINAVKTNFKT